MNEFERYKLQKNGNETSYKLNMSIDNDAIDNYIISRFNIREQIEQEKQEESIKKSIEKIIEDTFNKNK